MAESKPSCAICNKPVAPDYHPFCSRRCADVDLGRWLKGGYAIQTDEAPPEGMMPPPDEE